MITAYIINISKPLSLLISSKSYSDLRISYFVALLKLDCVYITNGLHMVCSCVRSRVDIMSILSTINQVSTIRIIVRRVQTASVGLGFAPKNRTDTAVFASSAH
jgi:hypothetical protein